MQAVNFSATIGERSDINSLFGPLLAGEEVERLPVNTTYPDILCPLVFKSRSQCRKAGHCAIPEGFTDLRIGKRGHRVTILKRVEITRETLKKQDEDYIWKRDVVGGRYK